MTTSKEFPALLILNYKSGKYRTLSTKKKINLEKLSPVEIPIFLNVKVTIPERPVLKAEGEIKLSDAQVANLTIAELESNSNDN